MNEPRTHYQLTLTSRQAVGLFAGLLVALGIAFSLGLMTGLSQRATGTLAPPPQAAAEARTVTSPASSADALPPIETAVPTATGAAANALRSGVTPPPGEPTPPSTRSRTS